MPARLLSSRFVIVAGKGGVGKSTVCAALGLAAARAGLRTCIVELNTRQRATFFFDRPASGYEPTRLDDTLPLYATNLIPNDALREYGLMKLRFKTVFNLVFENDLMKRLMRMIPGMNETLLLGKAWHMEEKERKANGSPLWDLLVVDAPATGHGVSLLRLPSVILEAVPVGPMADDARKMRALLEDPARTSFNVVTLPAEMPSNEALELCEQSRSVLRVPTGYLFANAVLPLGLEGSRAELVAKARARIAGLDGGVASALRAAELYEERRAIESQHLVRLERDAGFPLVKLPFVFDVPFGRKAIEAISEAAVAGMEAADATRPGRRSE